MSELRFIAYGTPRPQGISQGIRARNRASITSDNTKLKPYRHTLTQVAMEKLSEMGLRAPLCPRGVAVEVSGAPDPRQAQEQAKARHAAHL